MQYGYLYHQALYGPFETERAATDHAADNARWLNDVYVYPFSDLRAPVTIPRAAVAAPAGSMAEFLAMGQ
jgi:hypothetical protein